MLHMRRLVLSHRCWAATLLGLALLFKALMPAGFMPVVSGKTLTVELCSSGGAGPITLHIPVEGKDKTPQTQSDQTCAFGGLTAQALAATDPVVLEAALAFIFATALLQTDLRLPRHETYLRPPLRGPPANA
ncbi:hypothetical protein M2346_002274 [Sphingobium xanthum]|nr:MULTISPECIES: DUF2946 family protein [Sphingobium]MCW2364349.1 hypothetical protein [Sphingobium sp. B10D3B]MCW2402254.1 hypothetical protein [Sphingobium sp. B10D7B]MCW2409233.1 hypothetical protein [Sphingobium xanthum]MCW2411305.1 hypothetical protein [Sphingobium sp. B8D3D]MCW2416403.1 hypothetical protein [Sphingobium sp. B8D3A]